MIVGVRRLGSPRIQLGQTTETLAVREWVALDGPLGEEPALVLIAPEQPLLVGEMPPTLPLRRLSEEERARLPQLAELALELSQRTAGFLAELGEPLQLTGLRVTLASAAVIECWGQPLQRPVTELASQLAERLGHPVYLDVLGGERPTSLAGSLGRLPEGELNLSLLARQRLGIEPGMAAPPIPGGYPRLGHRVATPVGTGTVRSVSTRHQTVTVELDDGSRHEVGVEHVRGADP
jgi:hypothetical protein